MLLHQIRKTIWSKRRDNIQLAYTLKLPQPMLPFSTKSFYYMMTVKRLLYLTWQLSWSNKHKTRRYLSLCPGFPTKRFLALAIWGFSALVSWICAWDHLKYVVSNAGHSLFLESNIKLYLERLCQSPVSQFTIKTSDPV